MNYKLKISHDANFKNQQVIEYKDNSIISGSHKIFVSRNKRDPWPQNWLFRSGRV